MALEAILAAKRRRLASQPPQTAGEPRPRTGPGLADALARPWPAFILECKAASPSAGTIIADYDPAALAADYEGIADAFSVLTEPEFFGGQLIHLSQVRGVTRAPLVRKDFILGPQEVAEARVFGADAVLLMLSVLDDETWRACFQASGRLGMDALTEVHNEQELERALTLGAPLIGINNRNLKTLEVNLEVTEQLAPLVPPGRRVVSESGIATRRDVLRLARLVDGLLIGTSLSRSPHPGRSARELVFGRVKVCGLTRPEDAAAAWKTGAAMGGLIFAAGSPRRIDLPAARRIQAAAPLDWVGVFRNQPLRQVAAAARELQLTAVQLHGGEDAAYMQALRTQLPAGCAIWKAVSATEMPLQASAYAADRLLLDTGRAGCLGGSGIPLDTGALAQADLSGCVLAGGISPYNITAVARLRPWALDVNSGVEATPGIKSATRLRALFDTLRLSPGRRGSEDGR
ncbi:MAG: bifunctional indole-3-glycerol-phosphate synthase TrpC/phosphoribosylanthranilate isomerase TrpF [Gammaproteobacteria bacterium]|nr:bifunctional indole-3-glycerol-phosphate synthase TrpC/phosphoribosylanthranilate isomerase TrpF [Gammaproteobacteria bacterium]MDE2345779.1 bifunctional indole-3-glycerol-phosphate synthase TrpC/phosphoribosylanthranilate isomerase TrpF [Gammaproteobacteria bacterium]